MEEETIEYRDMSHLDLNNQNSEDSDGYGGMYDVDLNAYDDKILSIDDTKELQEVVSRHGESSKFRRMKLTATEIYEWIGTKLKKRADTDNYTFATGTITFGGFLYLVLLYGDTYIDKLIALISKASGIVGHALHGLGHGLCVGAGFMLSFLFEWIFLSIRYTRAEFDAKNTENNRKVYWDLVKRSLISNLTAVGVSVVVGLIGAAICVLTGGIACVVILGVTIIAGCAAKLGVKHYWNRHRRMFYNALKKMKFTGSQAHKEFS
eukprot:537721_1